LISRIGYAQQKATLFSGTIAENIRLGNEKLKMSEIRHFGKIAQADDFIQELENGYNSEVSQGGKNFSGGQKQRISIARMLAKRPEVYLFDDTFSALDYKTDRNLREALKYETAKKIVVIVAQRIGTIKNADRILVLEKGRIIGSGTHAELLADCPTYLEIAESQLSPDELRMDLAVSEKLKNKAELVVTGKKNRTKGGRK
jgi:ATP-binding cassette subfamily B protein